MSSGSPDSSSWYDGLRRTLKKNDRSRESKYFQIATVDDSGRPSNRTVVYRGFLPTSDGQTEQDVVTFVTDRRSQKVQHFQNVPFAEIAWYFPVTREQYRMSGEVRVIMADDPSGFLSKARVMAWKNMSDPGRQQFFWPHPGNERSGNDEEPYNASQLPGKDDPVAPDFCLCCLYVDKVSILNLKLNERVDHWKDLQGWHTLRVNP
jgi:pyridoxamine 5'-phosphate oxidase